MRPADFTPVHTTELGYTAKLKQEFDRRNAKTLALLVDQVDSHKRWVNNINGTQNTAVNFPSIAEPDRKVSEHYDLIHPNASETSTVRSVFIIGPSLQATEVIKQKLKGYEAIKPYLRATVRSNR